MTKRLVLLAALLLTVLPAAAQVVLAPTADAYVRDGTNATKNFGKATVLQVGTSAKAGNNYDSYLSFDLSAAAPFSRAKLRLFASLSAAGSVTGTLYAVPLTSWAETAITWNNKPARGAALGSATVVSKTAAFIEYDVTSYLLSERAQGRNVVSLAVHSDALTKVILKANSKEATTNRPQLVLTPDTAPGASLSAPAANTGFVAPASIALAATVADTDGSIAQVEFLQGTTVIGTLTAAPYTFNWSNVPAGRYSLSVRATDNSGVSTTSAAVPVIVDAPPTVSISAPADQSIFRAPASFTLSANAIDGDGSIAKVEIYQNGTLRQTLTSAPYSINVSAAAPGSYSFFAKAFDDVGISTQSAPISITVNPDVAPAISLTAPTDGAKLKAPASITVSATANDPDGSIARVDFYQNGTLVGTATQAPFSINLSAVRAGSYTFLARAVDDGGVTSDSAPVSVTVAAGQQMYYIHADQINTPRVVTDQSGKVIWRWDSADPFGEALPDEDPDADGNRFTLNLRFPGQYFDKETGLHYNYFRDYEPGTGRYVESDLVGLGGGLSTYAYAFAYPLGLSDQLGLAVDPKKFPLKLPEGWGARVDQFNYGDGSGFEIHVCNPAGEEAGVLGPEGWKNKHGHKGRPASLPDNVDNSVKGIAVDQLRKRGLLPPKGRANIKGDNWIKKGAKACKRVCGPVASVLIVIGGLSDGDPPHEIAEEAVCEAMWGCGEAH